MNYDKLVIMRGDYLHERYNNQSADIYFLNYKLTYCSHGDPGDYLKIYYFLSKGNTKLVLMNLSDINKADNLWKERSTRKLIIGPTWQETCLEGDTSFVFTKIISPSQRRRSPRRWGTRPPLSSSSSASPTPSSWWGLGWRPSSRGCRWGRWSRKQWATPGITNDGVTKQ